VSKVTEKIKTRSGPAPGEGFNSHPLVITNKKGDVALVAQNDIRQSLFHNEAGSLLFVILIRM
jgi:hypothetical protein